VSAQVSCLLGLTLAVDNRTWPEGFCGYPEAGFAVTLSYPPSSPRSARPIQRFIHKFLHSLCVRIVMTGIVALMGDYCPRLHTL
jgi:hypothetical protein